MKEQTLYLCDPEKHTTCEKTICFLNPAARSPYCFGTKFPEYAITRQDGTMIVLPPLSEKFKARQNGGVT